jgi:NAD(P)-dependent dehydrogenase (short-subunit alcohol dehydrogenase family)
MQVVQALEHELRQHRFRELQPSVHGYVAELSEFDQVRAMIERIAAEHPRLDGLVNNAALGNEPDRRLNSDGVERVWAVNVVAPCLLVDGLAPLMMRSRDARVVNMASGALAPLDDDLNLETRYDPSLAYCRSKQGLTVLTAALAEALSADRIAVNALDPGTVPTKMAASFGMVDAIGSLRHAAASIGRLLASPSLAGTTGGFFACGRPVSPPAQAQDPEFRAWLLQRVRETYRVR